MSEGSLEFPEPGSGARGIVLGEEEPVPDETAERRAVLEQKQVVTGRISETTRYIGFGLLAVFYGIVSSDSTFARNIAGHHPTELKLMALFGAFSIALDYLHYVFARWAIQQALDRQAPPNKFNKNWLSYKARSVCFWSKQVAALAGCAMMIAILLAIL